MTKQIRRIIHSTSDFQKIWESTETQIVKIVLDFTQITGDEWLSANTFKLSVYNSTTSQIHSKIDPSEKNCLIFYQINDNTIPWSKLIYTQWNQWKVQAKIDIQSIMQLGVFRST